MKRYLLVIVCLPGCALFQEPKEDAAPASLTESTVVGRNYGYALGVQNRSPKVGELQFAIEATAFIKNLELTGNRRKSLEGETFFGFLAPTRLRYR